MYPWPIDIPKHVKFIVVKDNEKPATGRNMEADKYVMIVTCVALIGIFIMAIVGMTADKWH